MEDSILLQKELNLIELCDTNSQLANKIVSNAHSYPCIQKTELDGIPTCIIVKKPLSSVYLNRVVKITGSIIKSYPVYFKNVTTEQLCLKCNEISYLTEQEMRKRKDSNICNSCGSSNVKLVQNFQSSFPSQSIRIQDMSNSAAMSETIEVLIEGPNAGLYHPGDKISATGIVVRKWKQLRPNEPMLSAICLKHLQIVKENDEDEEFFEIKHRVEEYSLRDTFSKRKFILDSFASEIFGIYNVKLGLILALIGGTPDGENTRTNSHVLLVGDPGTGKSHLLKMVSKLINPSVLTNGVGTSDAGLTSCAIKQGKEWTLEAGALVLADTGICCIDEFNRLKVNEKSGLLESMEQQTISIAKAGIVTSLNTRCSVFAAAGTRYSYDLKRPVSDNLGMSTPLISRFDLIFGLFDRGKRAFDSEIADKILERDFVQKLPESAKWSLPTLKMYLSQCRKRKNKISESLSDILIKYYTRKKKIEGNNEFNTIRMLESLVRLAESHSKLMNNDAVMEEDAFIAIILMESTLNSANNIDLSNDLVFFSKDCFNRVKLSIKQKYSL